MADAIHFARIQYTGIPVDALLGGSYTLGHGITPGVVSISAAPFAGPYLTDGQVEIQYDGAVLRLTNCRLADVSQTFSADGMPTMHFQILDRRWKWRFGWCEGEYNTRGADGVIRRRKSAQELARLLLQAMGERLFDVHVLPLDFWPEAHWFGNPAEILAQLCEDMGCRIIYNPLTDQVVIVPVGIGQPLPQLFGQMLSDSATADPPEAPREFCFVPGKTLWEADLELEAVGLEKDGRSIVPIDELSYKPQRGWQREDPDSLMNVDGPWRDIARQSVFRYYRIKMPCTVNGEKIESLERILPVETERIEPVTIDGKKATVTQATPDEMLARERGEALVYGVYHAKFTELTVPYVTLRTPNGMARTWRFGYQVDGDRGLVILSQPAYLLVDPDGAPMLTNGPIDPFIGCRAFPARLWLRTAVGIRDKDSFAWRRHYVTNRPGSQGQPHPNVLTHYVSRDDVFRAVYTQYKEDGSVLRMVDNATDVEKQGRYYLGREMLQYQFTTPGSREYDGFVFIAPDGAIQQISWTLAEDGSATTVISRNTEYDVHTMPYSERRRQEQVRSIISAAKTRRRHERSK